MGKDTFHSLGTRRAALLPLLLLSLWPRPLVSQDALPTMPYRSGDTCDTPFPTPNALRSGIAFWKDVFLRHGSDRVVLHDRENMGIVWSVVELPKDDKDEVIEGEVSRAVERALDDLRTRLRQLESRGFVPNDDEDRVLVALAGGDVTQIAGAWLRVRTQRGVADYFRKGLEVARTYISQIEAVLAEEDVPRQIAALPFVESMYNPVARSFAGAAGIWQLMPATARGLGLKVNARIDERLDIVKSTRAAARMLHQNFEHLGSWPLAITAYNHGPNGVRRAVEEAGSTDLVYLIDNYHKSSWGFASKNFYTEFLATLQVLYSAELPVWELVANRGVDGEPWAIR
jgi:membrane-bound lytic murein transglycosylase D